MTPHDLAHFITQLLQEKKAEDIVVINMKDKLSIIDYMVIASGLSSRQVAALADHVSQAIKQQGLSVNIEGLEQCEWVLVDAGDVIIHIFKPATRQFYNLEKMWDTPIATTKLSIG